MKTCAYCKIVTQCDCPITKEYKSRNGMVKNPLKNHTDDCKKDENESGIVFHSLKTSIHQDCLIEMIEKAINAMNITHN